jgi:glycosyltransferase involved in cell wall biosynthesis
VLSALGGQKATKGRCKNETQGEEAKTNKRLLCRVSQKEQFANMKIAILGSRGIPNRYGGFEELAEKLAVGLADRGHEVVVYNPSDHPVTGWKHPGVELVRILNPENTLGSFGQFIYDLGASIHTRKLKPDIILQLGYTSSSIWYWVLPRKSRIITNMDGLEWLRSKYSAPVKRFLKWAEKWAARHSHLLVADNPEIQSYLTDGFRNQVVYIPYGAEIPAAPDVGIPKDFGLEPGGYNMILARMEPENHIAEILEGITQSQTTSMTIVIGGLNRYGKRLQTKYASDPRITFLGAMYDKSLLNSLRHFARFYFHGHSVGGTNPSLLEAMACSCNIVAHNNAFNRSVLKNHARYFTHAHDITAVLDGPFDAPHWERNRRRNVSAVRDRFNWRVIVAQYEVAMQQLLI